MEGILLVDKVSGPTSHDVVNLVRRLSVVRRVGHAGTLDPFATGLLIVLISQATRLSRFIMKGEKEYSGEIILGVETETYDPEGQVTSAKGSALDLQDVKDVASRFLGDIEQTPPMTSAVKIGGEKLYGKARRGEIIEDIPKRIVKIVSFDVFGLKSLGSNQSVSFNLRCSSGTYVRSLANDLGKVLGVGAHLSVLRRLSSGTFKVEGAVRSDRLSFESISERIVPMGESIENIMPKVEVKSSQVKSVQNGRPICVEAILGENLPEGTVAVRDASGKILGIYESDGRIAKPEAIFS